MKLYRILLLGIVLLTLGFGDVNIDSNRCALVVKVSNSKDGAKNYIDNHYNKQQKRYITVYKTYNNKYAISLGLLDKDKQGKQIAYLRRKGYEVPYGYECVGGEYFKEEVFLFGLLKEQADLKFGNGPSFDCSYANGKVEQNICDDSMLANLDKINAFVYDNLDALLASRYKTRLHKHEKNWVKYRNSKCEYKGYRCIRDTYLNHIRFLYKKLKNKDSLYVSEHEANLYHYESNDNYYSESDSGIDRSAFKASYSVNTTRSSGDTCQVKAMAVCLAFQYGCSKYASGLSEDERYKVNLGCDYISNGLKMSREDAMNSMLGTLVSNEAKKQDGLFGFILKSIDVGIKINSWATCVDNTTLYLRRHNQCR